MQVKGSIVFESIDKCSLQPKPKVLSALPASARYACTHFLALKEEVRKRENWKVGEAKMSGYFSLYFPDSKI